MAKTPNPQKPGVVPPLSLSDEIKAKAEEHLNHARIEFYISNSLLLLAIVGSISAGALGFFNVPKVVVSVCAIIPGAALFVESAFKWRAHSRWHHGFARALQGLSRQLKDGRVSKAIVAQALTELETRMYEVEPQSGYQIGGTDQQGRSTTDPMVILPTNSNAQDENDKTVAPADGG